MPKNVARRKVKRQTKKALPKNKAALFATVSVANKRWLSEFSDAQPGTISMATMVDKILTGLRTRARARVAVGL